MLSAYKILVVDDEPRILSGYHRILSKYFKVHTAKSAAKARLLLTKHSPFAVVLADYYMPQTNGIKLLEEIKSSHPETERMLITGKADLNIAVEAVNRGNILQFLTKPCHANQLLLSVLMGIEKYTAEQEDQSFLRSLRKQNQNTNINAPLPTHPPTNIHCSNGSDNWKYTGQKKLHEGLSLTETGHTERAAASFAEAIDYFEQAGAYKDYVRAILCFVGLRINLQVLSKFEKNKLLQLIDKALETVQHYQLEATLHTNQEYVKTVFSWAKQVSGNANRYSAYLQQAQPEANTPSVEIHTFGRLQISVGKRYIAEKEWRNPKIISLLLYLLSHRNGKIDRDVILEVFWPHKPPKAAASNFHTSLHYLRKTLGCTAVKYEKGLCWLNPEVVYIDAAEFETLTARGRELQHIGKMEEAIGVYRQALSLYQGDYLKEHLYGDWIELEKMRLCRIYYETVFALSAIYQEQQAYDKAVSALCSTPLNELYSARVLHLAVNNLLLAGKPQEAEDLYHQYQQTFLLELGLRLPEDTQRKIKQFLG